MTLSQADINRVAIIAALMVKEKSQEELRKFDEELAEEKTRQEFALQLQSVLSSGVYKATEEFMDVVISRIRSNVQLRLSATHDPLTPRKEPPTSEEIAAMCEVPG